MGHVPRRGSTVGPVAVALVAVLAGCGGSVADADAPIPTTRPAAPSTPFCQAAHANAEALRPLNSLAQGATVPIDRLGATVNAVRRSGAELLDTAPPELRADVQRTVDALNMQLDALVRANGDLQAVRRDPVAAAASGAPETLAASQRVGAYVARNCPATR